MFEGYFVFSMAGTLTEAWELEKVLKESLKGFDIMMYEILPTGSDGISKVRFKVSEQGTTGNLKYLLVWRNIEGRIICQ